jgi:hypothetical protein
MNNFQTVMSLIHGIELIWLIGEDQNLAVTGSPNVGFN